MFIFRWCNNVSSLSIKLSWGKVSNVTDASEKLHIFKRHLKWAYIHGNRPLNRMGCIAGWIPRCLSFETQEFISVLMQLSINKFGGKTNEGSDFILVQWREQTEPDIIICSYRNAAPHRKTLPCNYQQLTITQRCLSSIDGETVYICGRSLRKRHPAQKVEMELKAAAKWKIFTKLSGNFDLLLTQNITWLQRNRTTVNESFCNNVMVFLKSLWFPPSPTNIEPNSKLTINVWKRNWENNDRPFWIIAALGSNFSMSSWVCSGLSGGYRISFRRGSRCLLLMKSVIWSTVR